MAIKRVKEISPLFVWFAIALLVAGAIAYASAAAIMEYLMAAG